MELDIYSDSATDIRRYAVRIRLREVEGDSDDCQNKHTCQDPDEPSTTNTSSSNKADKDYKSHLTYNPRWGHLHNLI